MTRSFSVDPILEGEIGDEGEVDSALEGSASVSDFAMGYAACMTPASSFMLAARLGGAVIPPAVGNPFSSRVDRHRLYFVIGNRSFTSSIVINFFSLLRRCVLGTAPISIGSPSSPFRNCLFR